MIKYNQFILFSTFLLIILGSHIGMHGSLGTSFIGAGILLFIFINLSIIIVYKGRIIIPYLPRKFYFLMFGSIFFSLISYYETNRLKAIIVYGSLFSLFLIIRILSQFIIDKNKFINSLVIAVCISGLVIIILGLVNYFSYYRYSGFYTNSNSMGMLCASLLHIIIGFLYSNNDSSKFKKLFFYVLLSISIFLLLASNSRAAILSVCVVVLLVPIFEFYKSINIRSLKLNLKYFSKSIFYVFLILVLAIILYFMGFLDITLEKFHDKSAAGSVSDGRLESWLIMIENYTLFGHKNVLEISTVPLVLGHNTWLSHMNYHGLVPAIFFLSLLIWILSHSWKQIRINNFNDDNFTILFFVLIGYIVNSTFETATSTSGLLISLVIFGVIYKR